MEGSVEKPILPRLEYSPPTHRIGFPFSLFSCIVGSGGGTMERAVVDRRPTESDSYWSNPPLEGFLLKKGLKGINPKYRRRWFILSDGHLHYYKSSNATSASHRGFIDLTGKYELEIIENDQRNFRIRTPDRIWYLTAEAEEEYKFWVQGLTSFKRRQEKGLKMENFFNQRFDSLSSRDYSNIIDEDSTELRELLVEAEREIEAKQLHIDDLYADLQNSLQVIKLRGDQIERLTSQISEKNNQILKLQEQCGDSVSFRPSSPVRPDDDNNNFANIRDQIEESSSSFEDNSINLSNQEKKRSRSEKSVKKEEEEKEDDEKQHKHNSIDNQSNGDVFKFEETEINGVPIFLPLLLKDMKCFAEFLEGDEPPSSAQIAINSWINRIEKELK